MSDAIQGLEPEHLWRHFAEIARIPRPSGHEERLAAYVLSFAQRLGLEASQDSCGNVVVKKPASPGRENAPVLCLQSHLDMVCEKNAEKVHDFMKDPIELVRNGDILTANGTTLGADNGIGVATSLAVMEDATLQHGPLEFLFTVEEETGLTGAQNLDGSLVGSRVLLNLDSEEEGALYVGCAGGRDTLARWSARWEKASDDAVLLLLVVKGLKGGHSGLDIDKGLGNAIKLMNRVLAKLTQLGARLVSLNGGNMRNAIPRECSAEVAMASSQVAAAEAAVRELGLAFRKELAAVDADVLLTIAPQTGMPQRVLESGLQTRLIQAIAALPHGVLHMSAEIPGLVETSTNVAVVTTSDTEILLITSQRSSVASRLDEAVQSVRAVCQLAGAEVETSDGYPGWQPNLDSAILKIAMEGYRALYGKDPEVKAIHAGLECGIIGERVPGMDMISFGPTLESVHSPDEKIYIGSVGRFWDFLREILAAVR